mgnify:FL=1|nr:MAG TPA: hypothetical protein [Caudoviricetes sp.]
MDPREAWDYTPGELLDAIEGYRARLEALGYFGYNLAQATAVFCFGGRRPEPWQAFPGLIQRRAMTDEEIWAELCGGFDGPAEDTEGA